MLQSLNSISRAETLDLRRLTKNSQIFKNQSYLLLKENQLNVFHTDKSIQKLLYLNPSCNDKESILILFSNVPRVMPTVTIKHLEMTI